MSMCYEVAVPQGKWPSFAAMNAALAAHGYPLKVLLQGDQKPDEPMREFDGFLSFHVEFMGQHQEMEVYCQPYGPKFPGERDAEETNDLLEAIGADFRVKDGDHNMNVGFSPRIPQEYWAPYCFLLGTLCNDFDGYFYDGQGGGHGGKDWGDTLIHEALGIVANIEKSAAVEVAGGPAEIAPVAAPDHVPEPRKFKFTFWRVLAAVFVALLAAEFIDKNIYNFTGAGG